MSRGARSIASEAAVAEAPEADARAFSVGLITTFAPEPYGLKRELAVTIYLSDEAYVASFFDAGIHSSGDNEQEAFDNLKSLILDVYDDLTSRSVEELGPGPRRQLHVLEQFMHKA
jgi:predicted RNase H-like HicB family nuclease